MGRVAEAGDGMSGEALDGPWWVQTKTENVK